MISPTTIGIATFLLLETIIGTMKAANITNSRGWKSNPADIGYLSNCWLTSIGWYSFPQSVLVEALNQRLAMTFNSTAIGVGRARTASVVLVAPTSWKYSL